MKVKEELKYWEKRIKLYEEWNKSKMLNIHDDDIFYHKAKILELQAKEEYESYVRINQKKFNLFEKINFLINKDNETEYCYTDGSHFWKTKEEMKDFLIKEKIKN